MVFNRDSLDMQCDSACSQLFTLLTNLYFMILHFVFHCILCHTANVNVPVRVFSTWRLNAEANGALSVRKQRTWKQRVKFHQSSKGFRKCILLIMCAVSAPPVFALRASKWVVQKILFVFICAKVHISIQVLNWNHEWDVWIK